MSTTTVDTLVNQLSNWKLNSDNCRENLHRFKDVFYTAAKRELIQGTILDNGTTITSFLDYGSIFTNAEWLAHSTAALIARNEIIPDDFNPIRPTPTYPQRYPANATQGVRDFYKLDLAEYNNFQSVNSIFLAALLQSMDAPLQNQLQINGSQMNITAISIFTDLYRLYGVPRDEDYQKFVKDYIFPFVSSISISAQAAKMTTAFQLISFHFPTMAVNEQQKIGQFQLNILSLPPVNLNRLHNIIQVWLDANQARYLAQTFDELIAQIVLVYRPEDVSTMSDNGFTHGSSKLYTKAEFDKAVKEAAEQLSTSPSINSTTMITKQKNSKSSYSTDGPFCFIHGYCKHSGKDCNVMAPFLKVCHAPINTSNDSCTHFGITTSPTGISKQLKVKFIEKLEAAMSKQEHRKA